MTDLFLTAHPAPLATEASRPRRSLAVVAAVARMLSGRPLPTTRTRASARGSPPGSAHLRRDLSLVAENDQWWRDLDRW